jgi:hypothetical protein
LGLVMILIENLVFWYIYYAFDGLWLTLALVEVQEYLLRLVFKDL